MSLNRLKNLPNVIGIDKTKCVNCHRCIGVCPVKYCNNASNEDLGIVINSNLCIACGACLDACSHDARYIIDDTVKFFEDLAKGEKIIALVAPAVYVNFPNQMNNLIGWLKNQNVELVFDVSFGAEITTYQYYRAVQAGVKTPVISQPCPAVVSYIEIYKPKLMKHLAPTGSPTMDMACWVHENYPGRKLAFISPCIGKKREFDDPNTKGRISYNVTIANIKKYLKDNNIKLSRFAKADFDGPLEAERGLLYSQPGGLLETFKRYDHELKVREVRRVEGSNIYEDFLEELEKEIAKKDCDVVVVDILNCEHGCNRGTGVDKKEFTINQLLKYQDERMEKHKGEFYSSKKAYKKLEDTLSSMDDIDFSRKYTDKSAWFKQLETPNEEMIKVLHLEMGKEKPSDIKNCGACGYNYCDRMAKAVLNGLYRPDQCHHYLEKDYKNRKSAR
jgi:iron only hydrogenase large subunit-like protein